MQTYYLFNVLKYMSLPDRFDISSRAVHGRSVTFYDMIINFFRFEFTPLVAAALRLFAMDKLRNDDKYDFGNAFSLTFY